VLFANVVELCEDQRAPDWASNWYVIAVVAVSAAFVTASLFDFRGEALVGVLVAGGATGAGRVEDRHAAVVKQIHPTHAVLPAHTKV
jgi:hypothetical protein